MNRLTLRLSCLALITISWLYATPTKISAANNYPLSTSTNWNIRIDGSAANEQLGFTLLKETDINGDGKKDLLIGASSADYNGRANSGSVYIIYNDLLTGFTDTGNIIDLAISSNYNLRIDGALANEEFGAYHIDAIDLNSDNAKDLILSSYKADFNSRAGSGSVYVIYNSLFANLTGTGNTLDLSDSTSYNLRFDGATTSDMLGDTEFRVTDIDNDNAKDLILSAPWFDYSGRGDAGAVYVIKNAIFSGLAGTGNNIDLATSTNYNVRYVGGAGYYLGHVNVNVADLNSDNLPDLILGAPLADSNTGYLYIIDNALTSAHAGTGNTVDLTTSTNYTIRYTGAASDALGNGNIAVGDINDDGLQDILVGASGNGNGKLYILLNSLISASMSGTGNNINIYSSSSFNWRIDGQTSPATFPTFISLNGDYNGDNKTDIIFSAVSSGFNSLAYSGSVYIVYNPITDTSTGNTLDFSSGSGYAIRYDGTSTFEGLGYSGVGLIDLNNDGRRDAVMSTYLSDYVSRNSSGSYWIVYNFPHSITLSYPTFIRSVSTTLTGTVSAPNSTTLISAVQFQIDSNSPSGSWTSCTSSDGAFDETTENYSCTIPAQSAGSHTIYVRAADSNLAYTMPSSYASQTFTVDSTSPFAFPLLSPSGYSRDNVRPSLTFRKSTDNQSIHHYVLKLDADKNRSLVIPDLPGSGNGTSEFTWRNDNDLLVIFRNEHTSSLTDDEINVYFKDLNVTPLTEGLHHWEVTAHDAAGNTHLESTSLSLDFTAPSFSYLVLDRLGPVTNGQNYYVPSKINSLTLLAQIFDPYRGSQPRYTNGSQDNFASVSSGPAVFEITIEKYTTRGYQPYQVITKNILPDEILNYADDKKQTTFSLNLPWGLHSGRYRLTPKITDTAGNHTQLTSFYLGGKPKLVTLTSLLQPSPPETNPPTFGSINEIKLPATQATPPSSSPSVHMTWYTKISRFIRALFGK